MPLLTQFQTFFLSPFGEPSACEELNRFLQKLNGVGEARVKQYGELFLTLLAETGSSDHEAGRSPF